MASTPPQATAAGPVLFAYDGSELAQLAIEQAGRQLASGRDALILCVWQPADVGFIPVDDRHFDAHNASDVQDAAEQTAAHGASLAEQAGFESKSIAVEAAPTWKGIVKTADEHKASLIVLGSHPPQRARRAPTSVALPLPSSTTRHPPCSSSTSDPEYRRGTRAPYGRPSLDKSEPRPRTRLPVSSPRKDRLEPIDTTLCHRSMPAQS